MELQEQETGYLSVSVDRMKISTDRLFCEIIPTAFSNYCNT